MTLWKLSRQTRNLAHANSAINHPGRFARNRAISKGLGLLGFWRMMNRLWR